MTLNRDTLTQLDDKTIGERRQGPDSKYILLLLLILYRLGFQARIVNCMVHTSLPDTTHPFTGGFYHCCWKQEAALLKHCSANEYREHLWVCKRMWYCHGPQALRGYLGMKALPPRGSGLMHYN